MPPKGVNHQLAKSQSGILGILQGLDFDPPLGYENITRMIQGFSQPYHEAEARDHVAGDECQPVCLLLTPSPWPLHMKSGKSGHPVFYTFGSHTLGAGRPPFEG